MKPFREMFCSVRAHLGVAALVGLCVLTTHAYFGRASDRIPRITTMYFNTYLGLEPFSSDRWVVADFEATDEKFKADPNLAAFCAGLRREVTPILNELDPGKWKTDVWTIGVAGPVRGRPFISRRADFKVNILSEGRTSEEFDHRILMCGVDGTRPERPLGFVLNGISFYVAIWGFYVVALWAYPNHRANSNVATGPTSFESQSVAT